MARKMLIDATHSEETRVVVVNGNKVEEFDFDTSSSGLITGNIYLAKVSRIEPSLQAAFVEYGGNRHGFLAFSEIHPDYFQIPQADRDAILQEEMEAQEAEAEAEDADEEDTGKPKKSRVRKRPVSRKANQEGQDGTDESSDKSDDQSETPSEADQTATQESAKPSEDVKSDKSDDTTNTSDEDEKPKKSRRRTKSAEIEDEAEISSEVVTEANTAEEPAPLDTNEAPSDEVTTNAEASEVANEPKPKKSRSRSRSRKKPAEILDDPRDEDSSEAKVEDIFPKDDDVEVIRESRRKPRAQRVRIHDRYKIQEVVKTRQVLLVQVIKEERGNKGAALTTYLSLPGRYCVLMPNTARGGGISRKISNVPDRKRLKSLAKSFNVPKGAGLIIRTAGAAQDSDEIARDYEFLTRQWNNIRELTLKSSAPAVVYAETGPIKRAIRDLLTANCDEILIEGEDAFAEAQEYMSIIMPDRVDMLKPYKDSMPLFSRYQVETHLNSMFNPTVQLPSGGYLVFGVTEALIAVDVNSGRSTKGASVEETAHKTNLEAAVEVARQLKLRDLAGLIVIDFIDMEQRRHQQEVENQLKDALRKDRARIQVGRISNFGLLEMSRQRLRTGLVEAITAPCPHCLGTGIQRSQDSVALAVIRAIEEEIARGRSNQIIAKVPMSVANYLFNEKRDHIMGFETRHGVNVKIEADPEQVSPNFVLEKSKVDGKPLPKKVSPIHLEESDDPQQGGGSKKRRRRGGRGRNKNNDNQNQNGENAQVQDGENQEQDANLDAAQSEQQASNEKPKRGRKPRKKPEQSAENGAEPQVEGNSENAPSEDNAEKPKRKSRTRKVKSDESEQPDITETDEGVEAEKPKRKSRTRKVSQNTEVTDENAETSSDEKPKRKPRTRKTKVDEAKVDGVEVTPETDAPAKPKRTRKKKTEEVSQEPVKAEPQQELAKSTEEPASKSDEPTKPKRKGWWSLS